MYICWNVYGLKWIWAEIRPGYKVSHHLPRQRHVDAKLATHGSHMAATSAPRGCHVSTTWQPLSPTWQPQQRHLAAMLALRHLPRARHVSALSSATSAATSSLYVMWQVNPWRSLLSQILGFGLGSMGFTPVYDGLRTSWITLIYDENLRTSREGIRDTQYMTFSNFVIGVILWWNFDDPWRKLTVIDHEIFCSVKTSHSGWYCMIWIKPSDEPLSTSSKRRFIRCWSSWLGASLYDLNATVGWTDGQGVGSSDA
jgi:hypothetical protein